MKILFGIIGALLALFILIFGVLIGTKAIGFQAVAVIALGIMIVAGIFVWKKHAKNEIVRSAAFGVFTGSIVYLALIFIAKTIVFSLISGLIK